MHYCNSSCASCVAFNGEISFTTVVENSYLAYFSSFEPLVFTMALNFEPARCLRFVINGI
jgi:hypothetical protein